LNPHFSFFAAKAEGIKKAHTFDMAWAFKPHGLSPSHLDAEDVQ